MCDSKAVVLFSGGQDSTTCLLWAIKEFTEVVTVNINYGQRHEIETRASVRITEALGLTPPIRINLDFLKRITTSALLQDGDISSVHAIDSDLPASFVPGRNVFLLTCAAVVAYQKGFNSIVTGVCQTDYSGYPDCRNHTIVSLQQTLTLALDHPLIIHTPLMWLTKKQTVEFAMNQSPDMWEKALSLSHTCYEGLEIPCGVCPACKLRLKGFSEAGVEDPIFKRLRGGI